MAEQLAILAIRQEKSLMLTAEKTVVAVMGNQDLIISAIRNLVENAIEASPTDGSVEILVDGACVSIIDEGSGVSEQVREVMFGRFWRSDSRPGRPGGLGLAIVRQIMDLHQGTIEVSDRAGGGTVFQLSFRPLA